MEIPENVKVNILAVLLSNGRDKGTKLDAFCQTFQTVMKEQLHYQALGYHCLMDFFQAMPDVVRLKYCKTEEAWMAYGIPKPNTFPPTARDDLSEFQKQPISRTPVFQRQFSDKKPGFDVASVCSTEPDPDMVPVDVSKLVLVPDETGQYTVFFPPEKRPKDWKDLREMFSMAGPVKGIQVSPKNIFVHYESADVVRLAFKMFPFLGLKVAKRNDGTKQGNFKKEKKQKPRLEVVVTDLDNGQTITKVHLEELFLGYRILSINIIYNRDLSTQRAFVKLPTEMEANALIKRFNGFLFHGKPLTLFLRDDCVSMKKKEAEARLAQVSSYEERGARHSVPKRGPLPPHLEVMPDLEQMIPGLEPVMPGLKQVMPGLEWMCSRERPAMQKQPLLSSLEERVKQTGVEIPAIFVTNFRNTFTEKDLGRWFADYEPISICFIPSAKGMQKAHIELPSVDMMKKAISEMCYKKIQGLNLKVDVPYFLPKLREEILGTNGWINPRGWKVRKPPQVMGDAGLMQELVEARSCVVKSLMLPKLKLAPGKQVEVVVTSVISDCLFLGQIVDRDSMEKLKQISVEINKPCINPSIPKCQGPCIAMYSKDKRFYRGWILTDCSKSKDAEVFYVDYGNLDTVQRCNLRSNMEPWMWELPPMAVPFTLTEPILKLKERLHTHITVEVITMEKDNMVVAKAVSLLPKWKMTLNTDTLLC